MANRKKTGRVVGTVAAIGVVITIIYMATRPHVQLKDNSNLHLLHPPAAQTTDNYSTSQPE